MKPLSFRLAVVVILFAVAAFFHPIILGEGHLWDDFQNHFGPMFDFAGRTLARGELPLWIAEMHGGYPATCGSTHWAYPGVLALVPFSGNGHVSSYAIEIVILLHVVLLGVSAYIWFRVNAVRPAVALAGAAALCLGSHFITWLTSPTTIIGVCWVPLILAGLDLFLGRSGWRYLLLAGAAAGLSFLGGHPQWSINIYLFVGAYFILRILFQIPGRSRLRSLGRAAAALGVVFAIAALVGATRLLPEFEYTRQSHRALNPDQDWFEQAEVCRPVWVVANLVYPHAWGDVQGNGERFLYWGRAGYAHVTGFWYTWEDATYVGLLPLVLALLGIVYGRRDRRILVLALLTTAALFYGYGIHNPFRSFMASFFPILRQTRCHGRLTSCWIGFALPAMATFALETVFQRARSDWSDWLKSRRGRWHLIAWTMLLLGGATLLFLALRNRFPQPAAQRALIQDYFILLLMAAGGIAAMAGWLRGRLSVNETCFLLLGLIWLDLYWATGRLHTHPLSLAEFHRPNEVEKLLLRCKDQAGLQQRFRSAWSGHQANSRQLYLGIESWNGYVPNPLERWTVLQTEAQNQNRLPKAYDLMNVRFDINEAAATGQLRNRAATMAPRAFTVHQTTTSTYPAVISQVLAEDFDCRRFAYVEGAPVDLQPLPAGQQDRVEIVTYGNQRRRVRVQMAADGLLVFSEHYYPGWRATVDGRPAELRQVDGVLCGVVVPSGEHVVDLRFAPTSVFLGLGITLVSLPLAVGIPVWLIRGQRRRSK